MNEIGKFEWVLEVYCWTAIISVYKWSILRLTRRERLYGHYEMKPRSLKACCSLYVRLLKKEGIMENIQTRIRNVETGEIVPVEILGL